jgi:lysozyme
MNWYKTYKHSQYEQDQINQLIKEAQLASEWGKLISLYGVKAIMMLAGAWGVNTMGIQDAFARQPQKVIQELEKNKIKEPQNDAQPLKQVSPQASGASVQECMKFIEPHEGKRYKVYPDKMGIPTVGIGFNLNRGDARAKMQSIGANYSLVRSGKQKLNDQQIEILFKSDVQDAINSAKSLMPSFASQPKEAQLVFTDLVFNLGAAGAAKFKNTLKAFEAKNYAKAAEGLKNSQWYNQVQPSRSHTSVQMIANLNKNKV